MRTLMITVGISLLSNRGWKRGEPLPEPTQVAADLQNADLTKASAETSTLAALPLRVKTTVTDGRQSAGVKTPRFVACSPVSTCAETRNAVA